MKKKLLLILLVLAMVCAGVLAACTNSEELVMSDVSFDEGTRVVSWDKVENATGYSLRVGDGAAVTKFTENGNKIEYVLNEAESKTYTVYVKAIGNGANYLDSAEKSVTADYTKQLALGRLTYNAATRVVSWDEVEDAVGYYLRVENGSPVSTFTTNNGKVEYHLTESLPGAYMVYVKAIAEIGVNEDSVEQSVQAFYTIDLVMGDVSYDPARTVVSWDNVTHARGYSLTVGDGTPVTEFTQNGSKWEYVLDEATPGDYDIYVKALGGNGWLDSAEKMKIANFKLLLTMGDLEYDPETRIVSWDKVANASGYSLSINNGAPITDGFVEDGDKMTFVLPFNVTPGAGTISVNAVGNASYGDSAAKTIELNLVGQLDAPQVNIFMSNASWSAVALAEGYEVQIDDGAIVTLGKTELSYLLLYLIEAKPYAVKVRTIGGAGTLPSDWAVTSYKPSHNTVVGGYNFSAYIDQSGKLYTWGNGTGGKLGTGNVSDVNTPTSIMGKGDLPSGAKIALVTAPAMPVFSTSAHAMALDTQGNLYFFGNSGDSDGQGGDFWGTLPKLTNPDGVKFVTASSGRSRQLAIDTNGDIWTWGMTKYGAYGLGDGGTNAISRPYKLTVDGEKFAVVNASGDSSYAITVDGRLYSWGANNYGQLGLGDTATKQKPTAVPTEKRIVAVSGSGDTGGYGNDNSAESTIILDEDGGIWTTGRNANGQLGLGDTNNRNTFTQVTLTGDPKIVAISGSGIHMIVLDEDGSIWSWGSPANGRLGNDSDFGTTSHPAKLTVAGVTFAAIGRAGNSHSFAMTADGTLYAWGDGTNRKLGFSDTNARLVPTATTYKALI